MPQFALRGAMQEWVQLLGGEWVVTTGRELDTAATATFATGRTIPAILRPGNCEELRECVRIANRHHAAIYPVSSGKNWGYGSSVPSEDNCVLLDLRRMNRILDFNERLGYITVEPGVTQRQVFEFLKQQNSRLWMDATGASPECSLIGNAMERGFGHTPYGDHFGTACGFEVVLPTGELIRTGFGSLPNAKAAEVYRWGVGPVVDGLFTQSNLGIVTRMTVWLMPAPEYTQAFFFQCSEDDDLEAVIDALRPLRLGGTLRSSVHIGNDYKVLGGLQQFPWERTNGSVPLTPEQMAAIRKETKYGRWNGSGGIYGTKAQVKEARRLVKRALRGKVAKLQFLDEGLMALGAKFATPYRWLTGLDLKKTLELVEPVFGLIKGVPTDKMMGSCYWRKRGAVPENPDPDRDGCGLLWCAPVAPAEGSSVHQLTKLAESILLRYGYEPMISLTMTTDRAVTCVVSVAYDRDVPGEDVNAMGCYQALLGRLTEEGFYSYRLGIQAHGMFDEASPYGKFLSTLKNALDPNHVLAPGRYLNAPSRNDKEHAAPVIATSR